MKLNDHDLWFSNFLVILSIELPTISITDYGMLPVPGPDCSVGMFCRTEHTG